MITEYFRCVKIRKENNQIFCNYEDYIAAREKQGIRWSEESFCNWCDKHNIVPVG